MNYRKLFIGQKQKVPEANCTGCGSTLSSAATVDHHDFKPKAGHLTVCVFCGHLMAFCEDLSLRDLTDEEAERIAGDPRVVSLQIARLRRML